MARAKNRGYQQSFSPSYTIRRWRLGIYIRLSKEDLKKGKDDSNSVKNQRDLLNDFYRRNIDEFESITEYVDDGHTGTDANREDFQRLLADVMSGKINCVIVKDLSRFARNYSDAGSLIDNLFVQMGVRFISLAENVDSYKNPDSVSNIIVPITNVMNDNYCYQTSKKIRQVFDYKRRNGQYIGAFAPYGFLHPGKKHKCLRNKYTKYCADMNVLLAYYNLLDDWEDEKNYAAFTAAKALKKSVTRIEASYPRQTKAVQDYLEKLHACEKENNPDLDLAAGYTGEVMAEIYIPEEDIWSDDLRQVGFYIGKFIYLMDALDDVEKDKKSGNYNPFLSIADQPDFEKTAEKILLMMTAEASRAFEKLPILENVDILRNILYAGIWEKYEMRKSAKERQKEEK